MTYSFKPRGICAKEIKFDLDGNIVKNVSFAGGCNGNLKGISTLVEGMTINDISTKLLGTTCGFKSTSCPDQLAKALNSLLESSN